MLWNGLPIKLYFWIMRKLKNAELNRLDVDEFKNAKKTPIILVLDNVRSTHNVGSIFALLTLFAYKKSSSVESQLPLLTKTFVKLLWVLLKVCNGNTAKIPLMLLISSNRKGLLFWQSSKQKAPQVCRTSPQTQHHLCFGIWT